MPRQVGKGQRDVKNWVRFQIYVRESSYEWLRSKAAEEDRSLSNMAACVIERARAKKGRRRKIIEAQIHKDAAE